MAADFKLNFNPANSSSIDALHERVADRIHHLCVTNGGLYIKIGACQLPPQETDARNEALIWSANRRTIARGASCCSA